METDHWYDIKVEVKGSSVKCWLNGRLVHDLKNTLATTRGLFASASKDNQTGEVILKVVNAASNATETDINLAGLTSLPAEVRAIVLTSDNATDENSLEEPLKVSPKPFTIKAGSATLRHTFPGNSLTVLRLPTKS